MKLISGNGNLPLAQSIADYLQCPLTDVSITRFSDTEIFVEVLENVRGEDVFVIQPTSFPANDNLMELLIITDALRRGSAKRISAVIPYYGYARQDRKTGPRTPISAKLVANLLTTAGIHRVLTLDLHTGQIQGFFDIPVDNLYMGPLFAKDITEKFNGENIVIVSPDIGGVRRARLTAERLSADIVIIDKRRPSRGESEVMNVIGDVQGRICIMIDDMVDSGGTLSNAAVALVESGAKEVYAYASHGVFSKGLAKIIGSPIQEMIITDTINVPKDILGHMNLRQISVGPLFGEAIRRIGLHRSVSDLFL